MTKPEWDKCFTWLMAIFPQWKVDATTSAAWYAELGDITNRQFTEAVRALGTKTGSPFPPTIFEIKREASPPKDKRPGVEAAWGIALKARNENATVILNDEIAQAMGACQEQIKAGDLVAARMAFKERYEELIETASQLNIPIQWFVSLGYDKNGRAGVVEQALKERLIHPNTAMNLLTPEELLQIPEMKKLLMEPGGNA